MPIRAGARRERGGQDLAHSPPQAACAAGTPCLLGQRAPAPCKGTWQPSCTGPAEPRQAAGGSAVQGSRAAAVDHIAVFLQLGTGHLYCIQVGYFAIVGSCKRQDACCRARPSRHTLLYTCSPTYQAVTASSKPQTITVRGLNSKSSLSPSITIGFSKSCCCSH